MLTCNAFLMPPRLDVHQFCTLYYYTKTSTLHHSIHHYLVYRLPPSDLTLYLYILFIVHHEWEKGKLRSGTTPKRSQQSITLEIKLDMVKRHMNGERLYIYIYMAILKVILELPPKHWGGSVTYYI